MNPVLWWVVPTTLLIGAATWFLRRVISAGAGYKAKVLSTLLFTVEREVDLNRADEIAAESYRILRCFRARVDRDARTVTGSLLGFAPQVVVWRPGVGSTLRVGTALPAHVPQPVAGRAVTPWERRSTPHTLANAVGRAFTEPEAPPLRRTRAVLVVQGGTLIAEQYAPGFGPDSLFQGWSVAKSLVPALVGILVGDGKLALVDQGVWPTWHSSDPRSMITVEDLLRMRCGLRFSETYTNPLSDVLRMLYREPDMAAYAASLPLVTSPGTQWAYSSGTSNVLSAIIKRTVGPANYLDWPRRVFFDRLEMRSALLELDAAGTFVCSSYMLATARDWARFGQFHLQDGVWNGERILPEGWMTFCRTPTPEAPAANYGAHWWLKLQPDIGGQTPAAARIPRDAFFAIGHEGQTVTVIPSRELVIVRHGLTIDITAWNQAEFVADIVDAL